MEKLKVCVYDPLKTFTAFVPVASEIFNLKYIDRPVLPEMRDVLHKTSDVMWYEFCTEEFVRDTIETPTMAYTVCRLHSYELFTQLPMMANWDRVDKLLVNDPHIEEMLNKKKREIDFPPIDILFNGVDLEKFKPIKGREYGGKNIAVVGYINHKKNLPMAIQCLHEAAFKGYQMFFFGESQDRRYDYYLGHMVKEFGLEEFCTFNGPIPHDSLPEVLNSMDYIASFSLFESFGQGIMEGIACGCRPMVHTFPGAKERFGGFEGDMFRSVGEFNDMIGKANENDTDANRESLKKYSLSRATNDLHLIAGAISSEVRNG